MFTGIIEETALVEEINEFDEGGRRFGVSISKLDGPVQTGESVALNGVCLTVENRREGQYFFHVVPETLEKTNLTDLKEGSTVNIERSLEVGDPLSGHMVMGHVDEVVEIVQIEDHGEGNLFWFHLPESIQTHVTAKGCIAIDGISLTPVEIQNETFSVAIIPETLRRTNLATKDAGDRVNVEVDVLARYVVSYLEENQSEMNEGTGSIPGP